MASRWKYDTWVYPPKPKLPRSWGRKRQYARHIKTRSDDAAWAAGYRYSAALVEHFQSFCREYLTFVRGSMTGHAVEFAQWQIDEIIGPMYGWVHKTTGRRRFRRGYVELTKKQGKTTMASCFALYALFGDGEGGPHVISSGPTHTQAGLAWDIAADMIEKSPALTGASTMNRQIRRLRVPSIQGEWIALAHSTTGRGSAQGFDSSFILNDELHEWPHFEHWRQVTRAGRARKQPIMLSITNAGLSKDGPCWAEHEYAAKILNDEVEDATFHAYVRQTDEAAAEAEIDAVGRGSNDIPVAKSANPAIGQIVDESEIIRDIREAFVTQGERGNCLRLTYSVWRTYGDAPWIGHRWNDCESPITRDDCHGYPCWVGLDVAAKHDFTAAAFVYEIEPRNLYHTLVYYWLSADRVHELSRFKPEVDRWAKDGWIRTNPGEITDHTIVREDLTELMQDSRWKVGDTLHIPQLIYDPRMAGILTADIAEETGCDRVEFIQTSQNYHAPCERLESLVGTQKLLHNGNPVLQFHAQNVRVHNNTNDCKRPIRPGKDGDLQTIDGIVALIMALSQIEQAPPRRLDYYEHNRLEIL